MKYNLWVLIRALAVPFYKENTGVFFFLFVILFGVVNMVDGAGIFEYHYSLAKGMLGHITFLIHVLAAWGLYLRKGVSFVTEQLQKPAYGFLQILRSLAPGKQWLLWLGVSAALFMPVLLYLIWVMFVGVEEGLFLPAGIALAGSIAMCFTAAGSLVYRLNHQYHLNTVSGAPGWLHRLYLSYPAILLLHVARRQKVLWAGTKLYTCGILYLVARNNSVQLYDIGFPFLFFNFGVLVNGILIYRIRELEETQLQFYRSLPVSLLRRWLAYTGMYLVLLLPELVTIALLTPVHLHVADAFRIAGAAGSVVLLMHAVSYLRAFTAGQYLKVLAALFGVQITFVIYSQWAGLCVLFVLLATLFFYYGYYRYQPAVTADAVVV